jgi:hypothetical protein
MSKIDYKKQNIPFTQIANAVLYDKGLSLEAKAIYAYLYSKPDGWDFAGNRIADELNITEKTALKYLTELKQNGYLTTQRQPTGRMSYMVLFPPMKDEPHGNIYSEGEPHGNIYCQQKSHPVNITGISNKDNTSNKEEESNREMHTQTPNSPLIPQITPKEESESFFSRGSFYSLVVSEIEHVTTAPKNVIEKELENFIDYWTERNKSGTRMRWETEPTFEVKRRIKTWLRNMKQFQKKELDNKYKAGSVNYQGEL